MKKLFRKKPEEKKEKRICYRCDYCNINYNGDNIVLVDLETKEAFCPKCKRFVLKEIKEVKASHSYSSLGSEEIV